MSEITPTWSVGELHDAIDGLLDHVFGDEIWIEGELRNLKRSQRQHVYFDLVDPDAPSDATRPMLSVTLFDRERQAVNRHLQDQGGAVRMVDGVRVRIRGRLTTYPARSSLQLRMSWIDPSFTLGVLGQERDRVLALLSADGLLDRNAQLEVAAPPLRIALVTSVGSAAHADALDELQRSGIGFRITVIDARTQGTDAERSLVQALRRAESLDVDVIALVRGGGARTDLAAFDSEPLARTIAVLGVPVITGIGHEIDRTTADDVAHTAHKTPTAAAASLVAAGRAATEALHDAWIRVATAGDGRILRTDRDLDRIRQGAARGALRHLERDGQLVTHLAGRVAVAAPRRPAAAGDVVDDARGRIARAATTRTTRSRETVDSLAARARAHDPARALERGWSITRDRDGRVVRTAGQIAPGDRLTTTVADGTIAATVDAATVDDDA